MAAGDNRSRHPGCHPSPRHCDLWRAEQHKVCRLLVAGPKLQRRRQWTRVFLRNESDYSRLRSSASAAAGRDKEPVELQRRTNRPDFTKQKFRQRERDYQLDADLPAMTLHPAARTSKLAVATLRKN